MTTINNADRAAGQNAPQKDKTRELGGSRTGPRGTVQNDSDFTPLAALFSTCKPVFQTIFWGSCLGFGSFYLGKLLGSLS